MDFNHINKELAEIKKLLIALISLVVGLAVMQLGEANTNLWGNSSISMATIAFFATLLIMRKLVR
jgi:hypothetical protein